MSWIPLCPADRAGLIHRLRCVGLTAVTVLTVASGGAAQSVRVRTIEAGTRRAIGGAIVVLIDSAGHRVTQGLTNESGRLILRAPAAGTFRLRADRIGHPGVSSDLTLSDTASATLVMPAERLNLPELTVAGSTRCERRAEGERTAQLWEEVRKALSASDITSSSQSVELTVRRFRRYRTLSGSLRSDSTVREYTTRLNPFVSPEPASLRSGGYIRGAESRWQFFGPDARVLLSEDFLEDHCFQLVPPDKKQPDAIGLGFRPVPGRKLPDIRGVLWVDVTSAELRHLAFEFVNVPSPVRAPGLGGRIEFERLGSGAWIIRDWYIRSPDRVVLERRAPRSSFSGRRDSVVGYVDEGGMARPVGDPTGQLAEIGPQLREGTVEMVDVIGRVVSSDGRPIRGASVAVAELDSVLATGDDGVFRLKDFPVRRLRVRVLAVGYQPLGVGLQLSSNRRLLDTTLRLTRAPQQLDSILVTGKPSEFRAGKMEDFERRRQMGFGKFLTKVELHDPLRGGLDMQLRRFARIRLVPCGLVGYAAAAWDRLAGPRGGPHCNADACFMTVYLDGALYWSPDMPTGPPDLTQINALTLEAVEVYRGPAEMPIEYTGTGSLCGVILLWTRVG